jgi:uncharacterized lipoprotein YddW (UPF0748 family)
MFNRNPTLRSTVVPIILIVLLATLANPQRRQSEMGREGRGMWVVRYDMASPESINGAIEMAKRLNINALFVQVNGRGEAYYDSKILPRAPGITQGFDPLAYTISQAHAAGIEVHAWINAYTISSIENRPMAHEHVLNRHPEWVMYDKDGRSMKDYSGQVLSERLVAIYLDPGLKESQDYVYDICYELVQKYPVDGLHFDYLRYPGRDFGYNPMSVAKFRSENGGEPSKMEEEWDRWRCSQVTELLRRTYSGLKVIKPDLKISAAVVSDLSSARDNFFQDWRSWLREGILDFIVLMAYSEDSSAVERQAGTAVAVSNGVPVYMGLGAYKMVGRPDLLEKQIHIARKAGASGVVLFSYGSMKDDPISIDVLSAGPFKYPTRFPH